MSHSPTAIINYSWDSEHHKKRVRQLANKLREDGIDVFLDQYETSPPQGWPQWMEDHICNDDFVLMVCTPNYLEKVKNKDSDDGKGIQWEGKLIYNLLYHSGTLNSKFIPLLFNDSSPSSIPTPLLGATRYDIETKDGYEELCRHLTNQPKHIKPNLGKIKHLPPEEIGSYEQSNRKSRNSSDITNKKAPSAFHVESVECAFCKGSGDDNPLFGRVCPVCDGIGIKKFKLSDQSELKKCSFCNGTGTDNPLFGRVCPVCGGIGVNEIQIPFIKCRQCSGSGEDNPLFGRICSVCRGTGYNEIN